MRFFARAFLLIALLMYVIVIGAQVIPKDGSTGFIQTTLEKGREAVSAIKKFFFHDEELVTITTGGVDVPLPITVDLVPGDTRFKKSTSGSGNGRITSNSPLINTVISHIPFVSVSNPFITTCSSDIYGADIVWHANASGGAGKYEYSWGGKLYGSASDYRVTYTSSGSKSVSLGVRDGAGGISSVSCARVFTLPQEVVTVPPPTVQPLTASCFSTVNGSQITWRATPSGGVAPYRYSWSGDALGSTQDTTNNYGSSVQKTASVTITDSQSISSSAGCSGTPQVAVVVTPPPASSGIVHKPPRSTPLSTVPYPPRYGIIDGWRKCIPPGGPRAQFTIYSPTTDCPQYPTGWTPQDVVNIMKAYPSRYFDIGIWSERPPGYSTITFLGGKVNEVQKLGKEQGVDVSKLLIHYRVDVQSKNPPTNSTALCYDLSCSIAGRMNGSKGDAPFNTDWIMRTSTENHLRSVNTFWNGRDPFDHPEDWPAYVDKNWISSFNTPTQKVALYGPLEKATSTIFSPSGFQMDLRNAAYRTWSIKSLLYILEDYGLDPNEQFDIELNFKPGWYPYYTGAPNTADPCFVQNFSDGTPVHLFTGPAHICGANPGGPFDALLYAPGEYETIVNSYIKELTFEMENAGYNNFSLSSVDRPYYISHWNFYNDETLRNPYLMGDLYDSITPNINNLPQSALATASAKETLFVKYFSFEIRIGGLLLVLILYLTSSPPLHKKQ